MGNIIPKKHIFTPNPDFQKVQKQPKTAKKLNKT